MNDALRDESGDQTATEDRESIAWPVNVTMDESRAMLRLICMDEQYAEGHDLTDDLNLARATASRVYNVTHAGGERVTVPHLVSLLVRLSNEAARAVTEPRRFCNNEDERQHALSEIVAEARRTIVASRVHQSY